MTEKSFFHDLAISLMPLHTNIDPYENLVSNYAGRHEFPPKLTKNPFIPFSFQLVFVSSYSIVVLHTSVAMFSRSAQSRFCHFARVFGNVELGHFRAAA